MDKAQYMKEYYLKNKDKWKVDSEEKRIRKIEIQKKYATKNTESVKKRRIDWTNSNFDWEIYNQAKRRAKRSGMDFNITREDVVIPEYCPYLGCRITQEWGKGKLTTNASIDRIDNSKGYIKGNIQIISRQANEMKRDATIEQLIMFAEGVLKKHKNKEEL